MVTFRLSILKEADLELQYATYVSSTTIHNAVTIIAILQEKQKTNSFSWERSICFRNLHGASEYDKKHYLCLKFVWANTKGSGETVQMYPFHMGRAYLATHFFRRAG